MAKQKTLAIIKPDAVKAKHIGAIIGRIEQEGFDISALEKMHITLEMAQDFYAVHKGKGFYDALTSFMASGPIVVMVLEKENAIQAWRTLMGATNPAQAEAGTLRKLYATSIDHNAVHGSDAPETARQEIDFFFPEL